MTYLAKILFSWQLGRKPLVYMSKSLSVRIAVALLGMLVGQPFGWGQTVDSLITSGLREPHSVAVDENNIFYLTDSGNNRIVRFAPDSGVLTSLAGNSDQPEGHADGFGILARFFSPRGIVMGRGGLVVADYGNHAIRFVSFSGLTKTLGGTVGVQGRADGALAQATFNYPLGLAIAQDGTIFVADSKNNAVRRIGTNDVVSTFVNTGLFEPAAIAIGDAGDLWVADTRNHTIRCYNTNGVEYPERRVGSGNRFTSGAVDALDGREALFNNPRGLFWLGSGVGLLVSDSGNHALRQVKYDAAFDLYSVTTFAGVIGEPGLRDADIRNARFNSPIGFGKETIGNTLIIVDSANNALRRIQISPPQPAVADPQIGYVTFIVDRFTGELVSQLVPVNQIVFNNDVILAVLGETGTETFFTYGVTSTNVLVDNIPSPNRFIGSNPKFPYRNGLSPSQIRQEDSLISPVMPDFTVKAIGTAEGRKPSKVTQARFQFKVGNPVILGNNAAAFALTNQTQNAEMWYTIDGSEPTNNPVANPSVRKYVDGSQLSFVLDATNLVFKARGFKSGFFPSAIVTNVFSPTNFVANTMSFGFEDGEASSDFIGSPGQKFYAPITLSLLPKQKIYTLQFNLSVAKGDDASTPLALTPAAPNLGFFSALKKPIPSSTLFTTIPPAFYVSATAVTETNAFPTVGPNGEAIMTNFITTNLTTAFTNLLSTNSGAGVLGVAFLERREVSGNAIGNALYQPLYDTVQQDLVSFSSAKDTVFRSEFGKVVVGTFAFEIPATAKSSDTYRIEIGRPSATSDGIGAPSSSVFIDTPRRGDLGRGSLNATKLVKVGNRQYIVGDAAPFRWLNAGDFGDTNLLSDDLVQVFESAVYRLNTPPRLSDLFDSMDSSDGSRMTTLELVLQTTETNVLANTVLETVTLKGTNTFLITNNVQSTVRLVLNDQIIKTEPVVTVLITNSFIVKRVVAENISAADQPPNFVLVERDVPYVHITTNQVLVASLNLQPVPNQVVEVPVITTVVTTNTYEFTYNSVTNKTTFTTNRVDKVETRNIVSPYLSSSGEDRIIDTITRGDGQLNVDDVFVTFRRGIDPTLKWFARYWSNGVRQVVEVPNVFRGKPAQPAARASLQKASVSGVASSVVFRADQVVGRAGDLVSVPIWAEVQGDSALKVVTLNVNVVPLDSAPELKSQVRFVPGLGLGEPLFKLSKGTGNVSVAWLDSNAQGVQGKAVLGSIQVAIPAGAPADAAYLVEIEHASGSPNGLAVLPKRIVDGLVTTSDRTASSVGDMIPDQWRLRYFGTLNSVLVLSSADADGDGMSNLEEFNAGTNPVDPSSRLSLVASGVKSEGGIAIVWPSVVGKSYFVESAPFLTGPWTVIASGINGTGDPIQFSDTRGLPGTWFYRVRTVINP